MKLSVSEAKGKLTDLVRRAGAGEEVILTRRGEPVVRLVPVAAKHDPEARQRLMEEIAERGRASGGDWPDAAHSADFLYDEYGLPK